tara:strand:- start:601 stop:2211 length:1611 start_codon:yes stop_codon:yes gene_type:complete
MAVVQISRIQHRRGKANVSGVPQLASGELGWAIDQQKLYIGNGSVSEGAPATGNSEILTTKSDILSLVGQYTYRTADNVQTGATSATPIKRSIAVKLDDVVSAKDFGALGDGSDQTDALQRAVDQLFLSPIGGENKNITLSIPAGEYLITSPIFIPPYANIVGDGMGKTLLTGTGSSVFYTKNSTSAGGGTYSDDSTNTSVNQPKYIRISDMSITHSQFGGTIILQNCRDSEFRNIRLKATWNFGDGTEVDYGAFKLRSGSLGSLDCQNNIFKNIHIENYAYAYFSDDDASYNQFDGGKIHNMAYGFKFGIGTVLGSAGQIRGPSYNTIENISFDNVNKQAIIIDNGTANSSVNNKFVYVGNDNANSHNPVVSIIKFGKVGNHSDNDYFQRTADLTVNTNYNSTTYPPEVEGPKDYINNYIVSTGISGRLTSTFFMALPADGTTGTIEVYYKYTAQNSPGPVHRRGTMRFNWNKGISSSEVNFSDDYIYDGNSTLTEALEFTASMLGSRILINAKNLTIGEGADADQFDFTLRHMA